MLPRPGRLLAPALLLVLSASVRAADSCRLKAVIAGAPVTMTHCAAAVYADGPSVTLTFSNAPFSPKEIDAFHVSSYAEDKDEAGKPRTMMHFAFCPGGRKPEASAAAVKSVETGVNRADSALASRQWVFELPNEKEILRVRKLAGHAVPGGRISGRITGGKLSDGQTYSWDATFDLTLPAKSAAAGLGCGN